ncbi:lactonase family protein [Streptomyces sp. AM 4-1-1]|uniref:lactonase family protein n=1 Tax=Streptomyces sp. AM 4-1-1 TaxID=3028710 RepID=UPI0023B9DF01|nr:lactonase family protein [Streptomyces sp. AM 4-1-1]WEH36607.1 lactonase family protein [Streptomyces sp. AM 4-1-1]
MNTPTNTRTNTPTPTTPTNAVANRRAFIGAVLAGAALSVTPAFPASARTAPVGREPRPGARTATRPLFLGTYTTGGGGRGIGVAGYDPVTGAITARTVITGVADPSYLAVHPSGNTLYAADEQNPGAVTSVALDPGGTFRVLNSRSTGGAGPCHLSVHPGGRWLLSANYTSGSVAVHPVAADGSLGERTDLVAHRTPAPGPGQYGPHAHQIVTTPDGGHVLAVDLGNDTVYTYRLDQTAGKLTQVSYAALRPGAGPRHLTFHPGGRFAYLACEVSNTAVVCGYDPATGTLTPGAPQSTGTGSGVSYPAQFLVTADGRFAYLANRGHNSLTRYAVEGGGASLRLLDTVPVGGDFPRHIAFSPDGGLLFAANQNSGSVTVFQVDRVSGGLRSAGRPFAAPVAVCALPL